MLELELWKIDNSRTAVKFNVVEQPNEWAKSVKGTGTQGDELRLFQFEFWTAFREAAKEDKDFLQVFNLRKAYGQAFYDLSIGISGLLISLRVSTQKNQVSAVFYISDDKDLFASLQNDSEAIEQEMGCKMVWNENRKDSTIIASYKGNVRNKDTWPELFAWMRSTAIQILKVFKSRVG